MLDRQRTGTILKLALPIIGGMVSQNVLNLVDTAMVGSLGPSALAAVGMGSFANFMAMAFIMGLSAGASRLAMKVSVSLQWFLFLPAAFVLGPVMGFGMSAVWTGQVVYRSIQALVFALIWRSRIWIDVEV